MKNLVLFLLVLFISTPIFAVGSQNSSSEQGKALHQRILSETPELDTFFQVPDMLRPLTPTPAVCIYLPISAWDNLQEHEKKLLAEYVSSLIPLVRENPLDFAKLRTKTSTKKRIERNSQNLTEESWEIIAGELSAEGQRIENTRTVMSGQ